MGQLHDSIPPLHYTPSLTGVILLLRQPFSGPADPSDSPSAPLWAARHLWSLPGHFRFHSVLGPLLGLWTLPVPLFLPFLLGCSPLAFPLHGVAHKAVEAEAIRRPVFAFPWGGPCIAFCGGYPTTGSPTMLISSNRVQSQVLPSDLRTNLWSS